MRKVFALMCVFLCQWGTPTLAQNAESVTQETSGGVCPDDAVFLALENQIRGFPLQANGSVPPCQIIQGQKTTLQTARSLAFSKNGYFHVAQFLTNGYINIFAPEAKDDVAPKRTVMAGTNDLVSIAVDSHNNDFVVSIRNGTGTIIALPDGVSGSINSTVIKDPNIIHFRSVAIDKEDNLLVAGYDASGNAVIDTLATSINLSQPPVIRSIKGSRTDLFRGNLNPFGGNTINIAVDPVSNELYVYNASTDNKQSQVSIFPSQADGDVAPIRVISGQQLGLGVGLSVSNDGRLFVAVSGRQIQVYAAGASGNVAPVQVILNSTSGETQIPPGIAIRTKWNSEASAFDVKAGPIWNNDDAKVKCPVAAQSHNARWNGQWRTTVPGRESVCQVVKAY